MLRYLFDTCVVSDLATERPTDAFVAWTTALDIRECALSVITVGEIRRGIHLLAQGRRRDLLRDWLEHTLAERFANRILTIDGMIAQAWGVLSARATAINRELPILDGLLLATAAVHHLTVVTRNVRDFSGYDVPIVNPWEVVDEA